MDHLMKSQASRAASPPSLITLSKRINASSTRSSKSEAHFSREYISTKNPWKRKRIRISAAEATEASLMKTRSAEGSSYPPRMSLLNMSGEVAGHLTPLS